MKLKGSEGLRTNNPWVKAWYLEEPRRKNCKGMWLGIFQPGRKELAHLGKWQNEKQLKVGSEKVESRSLERRKIKGQPSRTPQNGKVNWGFSKRKSQKEEIMKNKEETNHQYCWHNIAFGTQKSKNRRNHGTLETLGLHFKGEATNSERHLATVN